MSGSRRVHRQVCLKRNENSGQTACFSDDPRSRDRPRGAYTACRRRFPQAAVFSYPDPTRGSIANLDCGRTERVFQRTLARLGGRSRQPHASRLFSDDAVRLVLSDVFYRSGLLGPGCKDAGHVRILCGLGITHPRDRECDGGRLHARLRHKNTDLGRRKRSALQPACCWYR